jgi:hypothetical protein
MGGQTRCPGETGTNRRESQISIVEVIPRCSSSSTVCSNAELNPGEKAHFGIVILNTSPTGPSLYLFYQKFEVTLLTMS